MNTVTSHQNLLKFANTNDNINQELKKFFKAFLKIFIDSLFFSLMGRSFQNSEATQVMSHLDDSHL